MVVLHKAPQDAMEGGVAPLERAAGEVLLRPKAAFATGKGQVAAVPEEGSVAISASNAGK